MQKSLEAVAGAQIAALSLTRHGRQVVLALATTVMLAGPTPVAATESLIDGIPSPSVATSLPHRGDPAGLRRWFANHGVSFGLTYINDVLGNVAGGQRRGFIDQGRLEGTLSIDLEKAAGLQGLSFFSSAFQIHNTGRIRRDYVSGINTISAIEATPTTRLWELWLEQKLGNGNATLRVGQLAADTEFFAAPISDIFLQSDWATIMAANMPSGGPAYPLSTPGVRLKITPTDDTALLVAVLNGDPAGPGDPISPADDGEQIRNRHGLNFRLRDPALIMAEAQVRANHDDNSSGLARTLKIGGWTHLGTFDDRRFAHDGTLLSDPLGSGVPRHRRGNLGIYAAIEQQLYRSPGGDATSGVTMFGRISGSPSDRNLINFFVDTGVVFAGMIPRRPDDKFGASLIYSRFSDRERAFDRDQIAVTGVPGVVKDFEANLELTYVAQVIPGWTVQPVLTRVWHPNGDSRRNATVTGVRSIWRY